jgi:hypothetical protein
MTHLLRKASKIPLAVWLLIFSLTVILSEGAQPKFERLGPENPNHPIDIYGPLAFYHQDLFVESNIGLLQVKEDAMINVFTWPKSHTSPETLFCDKANDLLWVEFSDERDMAFYDGAVWRAAKLPSPKHGYISRGDAMEGFRWASGPSALYFQGGGRAWRWMGSKWVEEAEPPTGRNPSDPIGQIDRLAVAGKTPFFLMRPMHGGSRVLEPLEEKLGLARSKVNAVYGKTGKDWKLIPVQAQSPLFHEDSIQDLPALFEKLDKTPDRASAFLAENLDFYARRSVKRFQESNLASSAVRAHFAGNLNRLVQGPSIYSADIFQDTSLRKETKDLLLANPTGDQLMNLNRSLLEDAFPKELSRDRTAKFLAAETAAVGDTGYIRTVKGELLQVTGAGVTNVSIPSFCTAIVGFPRKYLLASFRGHGIYELRDGWQKLIDPPAPFLNGQDTYLAATDSRIALVLRNQSEGPGQPHETHLWIIDKNSWREIQPGKQP